MFHLLSFLTMEKHNHIWAWILLFNEHEQTGILKLIVLGVYKNSVIHNFFYTPLWFLKGWTSCLKLLLLENQFFMWHCHASNNSLAPFPVPDLSGFIYKKEVVLAGKKAYQLIFSPSSLSQLKKLLWNKMATSFPSTLFLAYDPSPVHCH